MAQWYLHTAAGDRHGPIEREQLDRWVEEGRITANCQIWCEGWPDWQMAPEIFPQLASGAQQPDQGQPSLPPSNQDQIAWPQEVRQNPQAGSPFGGAPAESQSPSGNMPSSPGNMLAGSGGGQSPFGGQQQQSPYAHSPYAAPTQSSHGHPGMAQSPSDGAGVASMILGIIAVVGMLFGCIFSCVGAYVMYPLVLLIAGIGLVLGFVSKGNFRVAGIVLNLVALVPAVFLLLAVIFSLVAA